MAHSENNLPKSLAKNLKCAECKQYLSVPPITHTTQGFKCGRCPQNTSNKSAVQVKPYETLAQIIKFPCRYDSQGCTEFLNMNEMKNHESNCKFKTVQCPIKNCKKDIELRNVLQHFQQQHKNLTQSSTVVSLPDGSTPIHHKVLTLKNDDFLLLEMVILEQKCWLSLMYFDEKPELYELYQLEIKSSKNSNVFLLNQRRITKYASAKDFDEREKNVLNIDVLKNVLNSQTFEIEIKFINAVKTETNNSDLLQELECVVCSEYMVPPIYICKTGHSVCSACRDKMQSCPTCREGYAGARNFALEKLSQHIPYPCKNKSSGCSFLGTVQTVKIHEAACSAKIVECPLNKQEWCHWSGAPSEIFNHARRFHAHRSWIKLGHDMYRNLKTAVKQECHVVTHDDEIFKVFMKHDNTKTLMYWGVEHFLLSEEKPKYRFTLQFVDQTNTGRVFIMKEACYAPRDNDFYLILPYNLLKPFMQNEKVFFRLSIEKISKNTSSA